MEDDYSTNPKMSTDTAQRDDMLQHAYPPHHVVGSLEAKERANRDSLSFGRIPNDTALHRAEGISTRKLEDESDAVLRQWKTKKAGYFAMESFNSYGQSQKHRRSTSKTPRDLEKAVSEIMAVEGSQPEDVSDGCGADKQPMKRRLSTGSTEETSNPDEDLSHANGDNSDTHTSRTAHAARRERRTEGENPRATEDIIADADDRGNQKEKGYLGRSESDTRAAITTQDWADTSSSDWLQSLRANDASRFDSDVTLRRRSCPSEEGDGRSELQAVSLSDVASAWRETKEVATEARRSDEAELRHDRLSFVFTKDDPEKGKVEIMKKRLSCSREYGSECGRDETNSDSDELSTSNDTESLDIPVHRPGLREGAANVDGCKADVSPNPKPETSSRRDEIHPQSPRQELSARDCAGVKALPQKMRNDIQRAEWVNDRTRNGTNSCQEDTTQVSSLGEDDSSVKDNIEDVGDDDLPSATPTVTTPLEIKSPRESPMSMSKARLEGVDTRRVEFDLSQKNRLVKSDHARIIRMLAGKADLTTRKYGGDDQPGDGSIACTRSTGSGVHDDNETTSMNDSIPASLRFSGVASVCSSLGVGNVENTVEVQVAGGKDLAAELGKDRGHGSDLDISGRYSEADLDMLNAYQTDYDNDYEYFSSGAGNAGMIGENDRTFTLPLPPVESNMNNAMVIDEEGTLPSEDEDDVDESDDETEATEISHDESTQDGINAPENRAIIQTVSSVESLSEVSARRMSSSQSVSSGDSISTSSDDEDADHADDPNPISSQPSVDISGSMEQVDISGSMEQMDNQGDVYETTVEDMNSESAVRSEPTPNDDMEQQPTTPKATRECIDVSEHADDDVAANDGAAFEPTITTPLTRSPEAEAEAEALDGDFGPNSSLASPRTALRQLEFNLAQKRRLVKSDNARIIKVLAGLADMTMRQQPQTKEGSVGGPRSVSSAFDFEDDNDTASAHASLPAGFRFGGAGSVCSSLGIENSECKEGVVHFPSGKNFAAELDARRDRGGGLDQDDGDFSRYSEADVEMLGDTDFDCENLQDHVQDVHRSDIDIQAAAGGMFTLPLPPISANMNNALTIVDGDRDIDDDDVTEGSDASSTSRTVDTENDEGINTFGDDANMGGMFTLPPPTMGRGAVVIDADEETNEEYETDMSDDEDSANRTDEEDSIDASEEDDSPREPGDYIPIGQLTDDVGYGAEMDGIYDLPPPSLSGNNALMADDDDEDDDDDDDDDDSDTSTSETVDSDSVDDDSVGSVNKTGGDGVRRPLEVGEMQPLLHDHGTFSLPPPPLGAFVIDADEVDDDGDDDDRNDQSSYETIDSDGAESVNNDADSSLGSKFPPPRGGASPLTPLRNESSQMFPMMKGPPASMMTISNRSETFSAAMQEIPPREHRRIAPLSDSQLSEKIQTTGEDVVEPPKMNFPEEEGIDHPTTAQLQSPSHSYRAESPVDDSLAAAPCPALEASTCSEPRTPPPRLATKSIPMPMTTAVTVTMPMTTPVQAPPTVKSSPETCEQAGPAWLKSLDAEKCTQRRDERKTRIVDTLLFIEDRGKKWWRDVRKAGNK